MNNTYRLTFIGSFLIASFLSIITANTSVYFIFFYDQNLGQYEANIRDWFLHVIFGFSVIITILLAPYLQSLTIPAFIARVIPRFFLIRQLTIIDQLNN